ncbi:MAG: hypothetical protein ACJA06_001444 [Halocynthiibacter sp.]|jgi:hypothetical protein
MAKGYSYFGCSRLKNAGANVQEAPEQRKASRDTRADFFASSAHWGPIDRGAALMRLKLMHLSDAARP